MTSFGTVADHLTQFMASFGNFATFSIGFTTIDSAETTCVYKARHLALLTVSFDHAAMFFDTIHFVPMAFPRV